MAKKTPSGLKDPFFKWSGTTESLAELNTPLAAAKDAVGKITVQLAQPGLGRQSRAILLKALAQQRAEVTRLEKEGKSTLKSMKDQKRMQLDIIYKLNALRSQLRRTDLDDSVTKVLAVNEKKLEELLLLTKDISTDQIGALLAKVKETQDSLEDLPEVMSEALAANDEILDMILARQDEAKEFLQGQRDELKKWGKDLSNKIVSSGVRLADKIGMGPLTLGNLGRAAKATYRGGAYAVKTIKAIRDSRLNTKDVGVSSEEEGGSESSLVKKFISYADHTRLFQRRMMKQADKKESGDSSLLSLLPSFTGILSNVKNLFGAKGVIGSLLTTLGGALGGKVLPMLGSLLKGGLRILGPLGALATAFAGGHWLGTQLNKLIEKPLAATIDYFFLKNHETGKTGVQATIDEAVAKSQATYDSAVSSLKENSAKVVSAASSTWTGIKDTAGSAYSSAKDSASSAVASAVSTASSAYSAAKDSASAAGTSLADSSVGKTVSRGIDAAAEGGGAVKDWLGKVFSAGGGVNVDGLHPSVQKNMIGMAKEYYDKTGKRLKLNSAYRSREKQAYLYKTLPKGRAAPPGRSLHEHGLAFDTDSAQGNELAKLGLISKYGFDRPIGKEPWHVQPKGITIDAANKGLYSADGPANQAASGRATPVATNVTPTETKVPVANTTVAEASDKGGRQGTRGAQPSSRVSVNDIPTYDMSDGQLLAMNLGILG